MYEKIKAVIEKVQNKYQIDSTDSRLLTVEEWEDREEEFLNGSEGGVFIFEGHWYQVINGYSKFDSQVVTEFMNELAEIGLYFEQGHAWNCGFYKV